MISGIPSPTGSRAQRTILYANSTSTTNWQTYNVPPNASMLYIYLLAGGGAGGNGTTGTASNAGGGGGGGSGHAGSILVPTFLLPPTLFFSIGYGGRTVLSAVASRVSIYPNTAANHCLLLCNPGGNGSNGSTISGGVGGGSPNTVNLAMMPLATLGHYNFAIGGQGGGDGGFAAAGTSVNVSTKGDLNTGGAGGGGLPATGSRNGGSITNGTTLFYPTVTGGAGAASTTLPPSNGSNGLDFFSGLTCFYGGAGGGSTSATATGSGLARSFGGKGGFGSGGGGGGAGLTGSTNTITGGDGGPGLAIIYAF